MAETITAELVTALVAEHFPLWADLPVAPVALSGWDNRTFRLGDTMLVRLPSHEQYVPQVDKEHRWLPVLSPQLPLPIPQPLARVQSTAQFHLPWSVYRWIDGESATVDRIGDIDAFAADLGDFLAALYRIDTTGGPPAGDHSFGRGGPIARWDVGTRSAIDALAPEFDAGWLTKAWDAAVAATEWDRAPVWVHGDITGSNLLVDDDGRLAAVLDFGCCAIGDPACDLTIAWTTFHGSSRATFHDALADFDHAMWVRARGWALWKALASIHSARRDGSDTAEAATRFGWRYTPEQVIEEVMDGWP